ncbi:MAG: DUF4149 domain-containing protein [Burkholderiaceae bacterium]
MTTLRRLLTIATGAVAGALALSAFVVAPLAFRIFAEDRAGAGALAGAVFRIAYWSTLVVALAAALFARPLRIGPTLSALLLGVLAALQIGYFAPLIQAHGEGWPYSFAALHAIASVIHLGLLGLALVLTWFLCAPRIASEP